MVGYFRALGDGRAFAMWNMDLFQSWTLLLSSCSQCGDHLGAFAGLVIEDVGVRDKAPPGNPQQISHYPVLRIGCSAADISIYICHVWILGTSEERRQKEKWEETADVRLVYGCKHIWSICVWNKWLRVECVWGLTINITVFKEE